MRLDRDPNEMTSDERLMEIREIFARGVVRALLIYGRRCTHSALQALTATRLQSHECAPRLVGVNQTK